MSDLIAFPARGGSYTKYFYLMARKLNMAVEVPVHLPTDPPSKALWNTPTSMNVEHEFSNGSMQVPVVVNLVDVVLDHLFGQDTSQVQRHFEYHPMLSSSSSSS